MVIRYVSKGDFLTNPLNSSTGIKRGVLYNSIEKVAADADGDIYPIFKHVPASIVPISFTFWKTVSAGFTEADIGLYTPEGSEVNADCLMDGVDINAAITRANAKDAMEAVSNADYGKTLYGLSEETHPQNVFDISLKAVDAGNAACTLFFKLEFGRQ